VSAAPNSPDLHILVALVENKFGVLARIAGLFSRRSFNIFSLAVAPTEDPALSRITIVVDVQDTDVEQIAKQLNKLINVLEITELHPSGAVEHELMLARVAGGDPEGIEAVIAEYGGQVLDRNDDEMIVSLHAHPAALDACGETLRRFGIHELQRTGRIALGRLTD